MSIKPPRDIVYNLQLQSRCMIHHSKPAHPPLSSASFLFLLTPLAALVNMLSSFCCPFSDFSTFTFSDASTGGRPCTRCFASSSSSTSRSRCFLTVGTDHELDEADL